MKLVPAEEIHSFPFVRTFQYQGGGYVWDSRLRDVKELVATDDAFAALRADGSVVTFGDASADCRWDEENDGHLMMKKRWKTMEHWETFGKHGN